MKDVSPGGFVLFNGSDFYFYVLRGLLVPFFIDFDYLGAFGPFSRRVRTNLAAYSFVKQSQIPSHATIMKSCSGLMTTLVISGYDVT